MLVRHMPPTPALTTSTRTAKGFTRPHQVQHELAMSDTPAHLVHGLAYNLMLVSSPPPPPPLSFPPNQSAMCLIIRPHQVRDRAALLGTHLVPGFAYDLMLVRRTPSIPSPSPASFHQIRWRHWRHLLHEFKDRAAMFSTHAHLVPGLAHDLMLVRYLPRPPPPPLFMKSESNIGIIMPHQCEDRAAMFGTHAHLVPGLAHDLMLVRYPKPPPPPFHQVS